MKLDELGGFGGTILRQKSDETASGGQIVTFTVGDLHFKELNVLDGRNPAPPWMVKTLRTMVYMVYSKPSINWCRICPSTVVSLFCTFWTLHPPHFYDSSGSVVLLLVMSIRSICYASRHALISWLLHIPTIVDTIFLDNITHKVPEHRGERERERERESKRGRKEGREG